jgi:hypothetical protein
MNEMIELIDAVRVRCFDGVLPNAPAELIARAVASVCFPGENPDSLAHFVNVLTSAIERKVREGRLAELDVEIISLRGKIRRNQQDEKMYPRIFWNVSQSEREAELSQLRDERTRLESALFNLLKEYRDLNCKR